jgi:hypothetical protein
MASIAEDKELSCEEKLEAAQETIRELQDIERKRIVFAKAGQLPPTKYQQIWIPSIDALNLFVGINQARKWAIEHNDPWRKLIFEVEDDGRVRTAKLDNQS